LIPSSAATNGAPVIDQPADEVTTASRPRAAAPSTASFHAFLNSVDM